jgi:hypothetical protein
MFQTQVDLHNFVLKQKSSIILFKNEINFWIGLLCDLLWSDPDKEV